MLSVTQNQGISEQESLDYLERSIEADATSPKGTFYFTKTKDVRTATRFPNFKDAMVELKQLGYASEVFVGRYPQNRNDVLGLMMGTPKYDWLKTNSLIMPGAICDNLTSYGGFLETGAGQTKLSVLLQNGSAGSSGTVCEPFALQAKFPHPRLHVHYVRGCTLAESFYQSVQGPFQLLIVGDALCRPFAKIPTVIVSGRLTKGSEIKGRIEAEVDTKQSPVEISHTDIFLNGQRQASIKKFGDGPFVIDSNTLPDGYHEFRFVPIAAGNVATKGSTIIPVTINNRGKRSTATSSPKADINSTINIEFDAPGADAVRLVHNSRVLARSEKDQGQFNIKAFELGRGSVQVFAIAEFGDELVSSKPVPLKIDGTVATKIPVVRSPPELRRRRPAKPKPKKPTPKKETAKPKSVK